LQTSEIYGIIYYKVKKEEKIQKNFIENSTGKLLDTLSKI
jgi:hypothetical protein